MPNPYGRWIPDPLAPTGYRWQRHGEPQPTQMLPTVVSEEHDGPEHPGGDWANADAYLSYDEVDSRTVIDTGAP